MPTKSIKLTSNRESSFTHVDNFASAVKQTQALQKAFQAKKMKTFNTCTYYNPHVLCSAVFFFFKDRD